MASQDWGSGSWGAQQAGGAWGAQQPGGAWGAQYGGGNWGAKSAGAAGGAKQWGSPSTSASSGGGGDFGGGGNTAEVSKDDDDVHILSDHKDLEPWRTFEDCKWPADFTQLLTNGKAASFEKPTTIQAWCWPLALQGKCN